MIIHDYVAPVDIAQAYTLLQQHPDNQLLAGMTHMKQQDVTIPCGIDLLHLGLNGIQKEEDRITIGSMTTYREIETSPYFSGTLSILPQSIQGVVGVQLRHHITIGGGVMRCSGACDLLTPLLALNASLTFYHAGAIALEDYCKSPVLRDILISVNFETKAIRSGYADVRHSTNDHCYLNAAVVQTTNGVRIAIGGQPMIVQRALAAEIAYDRSGMIQDAVAVATHDLVFADNISASASYRKEICPALIARALEAMA